MTEIENKISIEGTESVSPERKKLKDGEYIESVGRRKTAVARVRITPATKNTFAVNGKTLKAYFPTVILQNVAKDSLVTFPISTKAVSYSFVIEINLPIDNPTPRESNAPCKLKTDF